MNKRGVSRFTQFVHRNAAWMQVVCVVAVALVIILGPILLYSQLFHEGPATRSVLESIPWLPILIVVAIVAILSLLQGTAGVSVTRLPEGSNASKTPGEAREGRAGPSAKPSGAARPNPGSSCDVEE